MASTTNGTQILPGSNNASTAGRPIDTYDRNFGGIEGNGTDEGVDYEHHHLAQTGQLTESGYHQDGFLVDDQEEPDQEDSQPLETLETLETVTESRTTRTRRTTCCSCRLDDSEDDEPMDSDDDDSDYEDNSSSEDDDTEDDE
tara:strand:- start:662 stop:1090 length:429 start_codon:yes stop_codon:yes gene_type:complete